MLLASETSPLMRALVARGFEELTAVQTEVASADGARDLLVSAQTGSGKTVAYGLAIGDTLLGQAERLERVAEPLALVVAPTRELAMQVERELTWLFEGVGGRIVSCVGGMDPRAERRRLEGGAHIVVGTPGRLRDHIDRRALDLSQLKVVVLDEADEMLDLGFREELEFILEAMPAERRTLLFSATLPDAIVSIARRFQRDAQRIETVSDTRGHADIEHRAIRVMPRQTDAVVVNVLRQQDAAAAIVFCSTREAVRRLHGTLAKRGFSAVLLSGELGQAERNRALEEIREGRARVCVATDVAARGIDLSNVELVIHADLPHDAEVFQHRSGRTGRAGRKGVSVLLAPASRKRKAELLLSDIGVSVVWSGPPSAQDIRELDEQRLHEDPAIAAPAGESELEHARALVERMGADAVAVALLRLHRARLPEPEYVQDPGEWPAPRERRTPASGPNGSAAPFEPREPRRRADFGDSVWFRLAVGRKQNADPKWLLPMLCRRGGVTRNEIGAIRIFDRETKVSIAADAAERFEASALGSEKGDVSITRADGPDAPAPAPETSGADRAWTPHAKREFIRPERVRPEHAKPEHSRPEHAKPQRVKSGYPKRDRAATERADAAPAFAKRSDRPAQPKPHSAKPSKPWGARPGRPAGEAGAAPSHAKPFRAKSAHSPSGFRPAVKSTKHAAGSKKK